MWHSLFMSRRLYTPFRALHLDLAFTEDMGNIGITGQTKAGIMINSPEDIAAIGTARMDIGDAVTIDVDPAQ